MACSSYSPLSSPSNHDEGIGSLRSCGSTSPLSSDSGGSSPFSRQLFDVTDNTLVLMAKSMGPSLFSEPGHMVYVPCVHCTILYHKEKDTPKPNYLLRHRNHIYINHWVFFRCNQCEGGPLDGSENIPCPLQNLKQMTLDYVKHDIICFGGPSCPNWRLPPENFSCCLNIAFGETTFKEPKLHQDMKQSLTILPQVEFPIKRHIKHDCTTEPCVDHSLLKEALQRADCKLINEMKFGDFSTIYMASSNSRESLCIKAACLHNYANNTICHSVDTEIFISQLTHQGRTPVLFHYGVFRLRDTVFMVSPQSKNGNLEDYLRCVDNLREVDYRKMITKLCHGIQFLHSHCIAHRNLKLDNILVGKDPTDLKIAGLGSSCIVQPERLINCPFVSYNYAAPEFFQTRCFDPLKPDIWSLGVIMFFLFKRKHLFPNSSISQPLVSPLLNWHHSLQSKSFLDALLTREYNSRPNIKTVLDHHWLHMH